MKKRLLLLLLILLLGSLIHMPLPAVAEIPHNDAYIVAIGSGTPGNSSTFGEQTPPADAGNSTDKDSGSNNTSGDSSNDSSQTGTGQTPPAQPGGEIENNLNTDAYAGEKSADQQTIDQSLQQYGGPRLTSLSVDAVPLTPAFSKETFSYAAYVDEDTASVLVMAQAAAGSVYIDGVAGGARRVEINADERTVRVTVTAQGQSTLYTILILRTPDLQQLLLPTTIPAITHIQISNDEVFYERAVSAEDGTELTLILPKATSKNVQIEITVSAETLVYLNDTRVYDGYYHQDNGSWTWLRQYQLASDGESLLGVHLVDAKSRMLLHDYSIRIAQPAGLNIQLQVGNEQALVNDQLYTLDAPPMIMEGGHTVVPLRFVAEALGAKVGWQPAEQRVDIQWNGHVLSLFIGKQENGLPLAPFIENGRTMVPLRYVSEQLACQVDWLAETREIMITR